jgi:hypothetical protein
LTIAVVILQLLAGRSFSSVSKQSSLGLLLLYAQVKLGKSIQREGKLPKKVLLIDVTGHTPGAISIDPGERSAQQVKDVIDGVFAELPLAGSFVSFGRCRETGATSLTVNGVNNPALAVHAIVKRFPALL